MADTVETLQARRTLLVEKYEDVVKGHAAHSTGDRSYSNWDPATLRREIEAIDRQISLLSSPQSSGRTVQRFPRGR